MRRAFVAVAVTLAAAMGSAQAAPTTFTFNGSDDNKPSILKSSNGINLTIDNFLTGTMSGADIDGLAVFCKDTPCEVPYSSYAMTFDQPVKLISYRIKYTQQAGGITTTYAQALLQSIQTNNSSAGTTLFSNQFIAQPNIPISVTSTYSGTSTSPLYQISAFTVEKVDLPPATVPGPLPILGFGAAFGFSRRLRRRVAHCQGKGIPADT